MRALEIDTNSPQALNLAGVMLEMREEYDQAKRYYGHAIKIDKNFEPAQANMRRLYRAVPLRRPAANPLISTSLSFDTPGTNLNIPCLTSPTS